MELYDWNTLPEEQLNALITRKTIHAGNLTIARLRLQKYATVPEHSHRHEQITIVERGSLKFRLTGSEQVVRAGEALVIPPHQPHSVEALEDTSVTDVFSPAREDWMAGDDRYLRG